MKMSAHWLSSAIFAVVIALFSSTGPAFADSYTIYDLGNDNGHGIYGIDSAGDVVVWGASGCGVASPTCYVTYMDGVATSDTSTAPLLSYDDGTSCSSTPAGFNVSKSVCNNGWTGFGSLYYPDGGAHGVYVGSGSSFDLLHNGSADQVFLNSSGDFAWDDGLDDEIFVAMLNPPPTFKAFLFSPKEGPPPATTPEPGSWLLLGTGLVAITVAVRRRATRYRDLSE